jgi:ferredoxin/flavodoxin---NADP+ reductase
MIDMDNNTFDLIIIGAGPIGLKAAHQANKKKYRFLLIESLDHVGGQLVSLYPNKEIYDLSGFKAIKAKDYIHHLYNSLPKQIIDNCFSLDEKVINIKKNNSNILLVTDKRELSTLAVIIATGLGVYMPRLLKCDGANSCQSVIYSLDDPSLLKDKKIIILGGGDAALDWASQLSSYASEVIIVHRRDQFRGHLSFIENITNIIVKKPFLIQKVYAINNVTYLEIVHAETSKKEILTGDYIFVNYGHHPVNSLFGLQQHNAAIAVDDLMMTSIKNIFAAGDVASYNGKKRRIEAGFKELKIVFQELEKII